MTLDEIKQNSKTISQQTEQPRGYRSPDVIELDEQRTKLANKLPETAGTIAGRELRPGDKVPCRDGDIAAGVCKTGQTAKDVEIIRDGKAALLNVEANFAKSIRESIEEYKAKPFPPKPTANSAPSPAHF